MVYKFLPYITNDSSVGLFNEQVNDIYHSADGALNEAYEKFINPIDFEFLLKDKSEINVLDICYGIGYNTKSFLNELFKNKKYIKNLKKINIDCVDINKRLIQISPFIKNNINEYDKLIRKKDLLYNIKNYTNVQSILNNKKRSKKYKIEEFINMILIKSLIENYKEDFISPLMDDFLLNDKNKIFIDKNMLNFYNFYINNEVYSVKNRNKSAFVHNIYYKYISKQYKYLKKYSKLFDININFNSIDARQFVKGASNCYDIIFLDAFTPSKCPCLWSIDFIRTLRSLSNDNILLLTYNMSAPVRNALTGSGFIIGNILDKNNKIIGTVASDKQTNIKNNLSDKQRGLLFTKAGIPYRDYNLDLKNDIIIKNRNLEVENSNLESSSQYLKRMENEI